MAPAQHDSETRVWSVEGHAIRVVYWASVLEEIRAEAVAGYCKFPRGGVEVGGILFGRLEDGVTRILAFRPVPCEYKFGPSYRLSERDGQAFADALRALETDPLLAGLEPVGWYVSHTRSEVCLSEQDLELHNRHFPKAGQVALVVRPESFGTSRAGFFFREANGKIRCESSYGEFALPVRATKKRSAAREVITPENAPAPRAETTISKRDRARPARARVNRRRFLLWGAVAVPVLAVIAMTSALMLRERKQPASQSLALSALDVNGQLQIAWDRMAAPVLQAAGGSLEIVDGGKRVVLPFNAAALRRGSVTYTRKSGLVEVRLIVNPPDGKPVQELVRFVGAMPTAKPASPRKPVREPAAEKPKPAPRPPRRGRRGRQRSELLESPPRSEQTKVLELANLRPHRAAAPALGEPPSLPSASAQLPAAPAPLPTAPLTAAAPQRPAPSRPAYRGPVSGRLIWTGLLRRGQALSINGRTASTGYVTGELPGVPVRVSAYPAELSDNGLVVYTSKALAAQREPPGPRNGWNLTRYALDPERAARVLVTEPPSAQTGWRKLTLRGDNAPVAVIVIDWRIAD
ncbi:MAG TPA: hypothetical protein PLP04_01515 [Bryobacteraceae bacterium]|nr:hypothetical protein [Bryobacteraceae bacterium]